MKVYILRILASVDNRVGSRLTSRLGFPDRRRPSTRRAHVIARSERQHPPVDAGLGSCVRQDRRAALSAFDEAGAHPALGARELARDEDPVDARTDVEPAQRASTFVAADRNADHEVGDTRPLGVDSRSGTTRFGLSYAARLGPARPATASIVGPPAGCLSGACAWTTEFTSGGRRNRFHGRLAMVQASGEVELR